MGFFVVVVVSLVCCVAAQYSWKLNMGARRQWEENNGYCGEVAAISALLYYGGYVSQYDMRLFSARTSGSQTGSEYLVGSNDVYCAGQVKLAASAWSRPSGSTIQDFLVWIKTNIQAGHPVSIGVYMNQYLFYGSKASNAGDSAYDHIVPVLAIESKYNDNKYHADDIIYFSDNGESACIGALHQTTCDDDRQQRPYYYNYTFGAFGATRANANLQTGPVYSLASSTTVGNYGIAHTGVVDTSAETLPVSITTNVNNETPEIKDGSNTRPAAASLVLTVTVSKLTPNVKYNLYLYNSAANVPTSKFNANSKSAASVTSITGPANGVYQFSTTTQSSQQVFYRCVPASGA